MNEMCSEIFHRYPNKTTTTMEKKTHTNDDENNG